ncbi:MAG: cytochrome P450 [Myxococcota bacterium]|nr:cytochrome P450 [Myxococcota bacterium]
MIDYDPFSAEVRANPHPTYKRLRDEAPACFLPKYEAWALSRFQDIWDASNDAASYSTARGTTPAQVLTKDQPVTPMLNVMDPPDHTRLRSVIRGCFLPRHLRKLEPVVRREFERLVDEVIDRGECDVVRDLAAKLSVKVACLAIGLPVEDGDLLTGMVSRFFSHDPDAEGMTPDGLAALQELNDYCVDRIRERRVAPGDGPEALDALVKFELNGRAFGDEEAASHTTMLIIGGSETFPKTLANGVVRLAEHPDQRAALAADPSGIPDAYDEILRYDMPTQFLCRTLKRDVELHGQTLREGQGVMFLYASANRDDREFENPDVFDVRRRPERILSFGAGTHACLGTHVARLEGRITLETLLARMPEYTVDLDRAEKLRTEFVQGYASLPIRF